MRDTPFPTLRLVALLWLVVYLPSYTWAYGTLNFLFLCNLGVLLTAIGIWWGSPLLLGSQGVAAPVICLAWGLDAGWRVVSGDFLFGGTSYMWDPQYPLFTRLLSLYHLVWPFVLLHAIRRTGYDRRGLPLQSAIAAGAIGAGRLLDPSLNLNFAFRDPIFGLALEPAIVQIALILGGATLAAYLPAHLALTRVFPSPRPLAADRRSRLERRSV